MPARNMPNATELESLRKMDLGFSDSDVTQKAVYLPSYSVEENVVRTEQLLASPSENVRKRSSESDCALMSHTSPPSTLHADIMQEPCIILLTRSSDLETDESLQSFHRHPIALLP